MRASLLQFLMLAIAAVDLQAQSSCIEQVRLPEVGRWAEYKVVFKQKEPSTMRWAVIGQESRDGQALKWVEMRMGSTEKDGNMVYQTLVPGSGGKPSDVKEIVLKHGDKPAMKLDGMMLQMIRRQMEKESMLHDMCKDMSLVGGETVSVPAGRFKSQRFHNAKSVTNIWISKAVPFSMVKTASPNHESTLLRHGDGAKSSITERPQSGGLNEFLTQ
jgi:hypothetical protein